MTVSRKLNNQEILLGVVLQMKLAIIGGGFVRKFKNLHINKRLVELVANPNPNVLFYLLRVMIMRTI
jgi:hypothetical protein